jgi:hypothetical protein
VADGATRQRFSEDGDAVEAEGLASVNLEVFEEKGTNAVLVEVEATPERLDDARTSAAVDDVD